MKSLGIIMARSGSKGIKDKNIRNLNGKPLISYTIEHALKSRYIDEVMVSTDSKKYAEIAKAYGAKVPFFRSKENSTDTSKSIDVVFEVLENYGKLGIYFDNIIILQPTSPLRTYKNIDGAFELYYDKNADSVVSVCECEHNPILCNVLPENMSLLGFIDEKNIQRRQDMKCYYRINGAIYISKVRKLREKKTFYHEKSYAYIMGQMESVDIDTELDFSYAEFLIRQYEKQKF